MLTSFFGKSNPINYLITCLVIFLVYLVMAIKGFEGEFSWLLLGEHLLRLGLAVFSVLLLDFIIRKNGLTMSNTYGIFLFSCFLISVPIILNATNLLVANTFILLAFRRFFSLPSGINTDKKILDASIWITLASFFYFGSILLIPLLYLAVVRRDGFRFRQLFIPIVGAAAVFSIVIAVRLLLFDSLGWVGTLVKMPGYDFSVYGEMALWLPATLMTTLVIWTGVSGLRSISTLPKKDRPTRFLLLATLAFSFLVILAAFQKTGAEMLFIMAPLAITVGNYVERLEEFWFKELLLWVTLLLAIWLIVAPLL